jgi:hypothetical protein
VGIPAYIMWAVLIAVMVAAAIMAPEVRQILLVIVGVVLTLLKMAWQSETLWLLAGTILGIWFFCHNILWPLQEIERVKRRQLVILRDLELIKDQLRRIEEGK